MELAQELLAKRFYHGDEQPFLVAELAVDIRLRAPALLDDLVHADARVAVLEKQRRGRAQQLLATLHAPVGRAADGGRPGDLGRLGGRGDGAFMEREKFACSRVDTIPCRINTRKTGASGWRRAHVDCPALPMSRRRRHGVDQLLSMKLFCRIAELGSFKAAALDLGLSEVKASRLIGELESQLNQRLLQRSAGRRA
jgi:hypothetical protein